MHCGGALRNPMVSWISIPFAEELYSETFLCIERDRVEFIKAFIEGRRFELFVACENCGHGNFRFAGPLLVAGNCFLRGAFEKIPDDLKVPGFCRFDIFGALSAAEI